MVHHAYIKEVERYKLLVKLVHLRKSTQEIYLRSWISRATHYSSGSRRGLYKIEEGNYPSHSTLTTLCTIRSYSNQYGLCCEVIVYLVCIVVANIGVVQCIYSVANFRGQSHNGILRKELNKKSLLH